MDSAQGAIQPGLKILEFSPRPNGPETLKKSYVIETEYSSLGDEVNFDIRSDFVFQETRWLPLRRRNDFSGMKEIN